MPGTSEDDRAAVDRAFAALVAGYHLTADRPDPLPRSATEPARLDHLPVDLTATEPAADDERAPDPVRADPPPVPGPAPRTPAEPAGPLGSALFRFPDPAAGAQPPGEDHPDVVDEVDPFVPGPPMPIPRPAWPVLVAWIAMGYAVLVVLAISVGIRLPAWAGWLALVGFVGGFGTLVSRLPRHRPPDAGDGAVL